MDKFIAATAKELLLLTRDKTGLLVLFLMPAILVIVITLVQENVLELSGQHNVELLLEDQDHGPFAEALRNFLTAGEVEIKDYSPDTGDGLRNLVTEGRYQAGLIIAAGSSKKLTRELANRFSQANNPGKAEESAAVSLDLIFDPAALAGYRIGMAGRLQLAARAAEMQMLADQLGQQLARAAQYQQRSTSSPLQISATTLQQTLSKGLTVITERGDASEGKMDDLFNPVNRNVPAWALFGMFFTAIPIAGTILAERKSSISMRLTTMPVSPLTLMLSMVTAYLLICCCQFLLIVLIGIHLFPRLGLAAFTLPDNPIVLLPGVISSALAACGLGTLLGNVCRSYEQASTLGATMVVSGAALGGLMVPVYAMPQTMQKISVISPLNWGVNAFLELLVRGQDLSATYPDLARLLLFAAVAILLGRWIRH